MIETLDTCQWVEVKGRGGNETDLIIHLHDLEDVKKQTNFESCVADVNIPVGEVFTSPVLAGTGGILHVKKVYLNGLQFRDLKLVFDCGQVIDYTCSNFRQKKRTARISRTISCSITPRSRWVNLRSVPTRQPMSLLRNTVSQTELPILIGRKDRTAFAVGDTCYSLGKRVLSGI